MLPREILPEDLKPVRLRDYGSFNPGGDLLFCAQVDMKVVTNALFVSLERPFPGALSMQPSIHIRHQATQTGIPADPSLEQTTPVCISRSHEADVRGQLANLIPGKDEKSVPVKLTVAYRQCGASWMVPEIVCAEAATNTGQETATPQVTWHRCRMTVDLGWGFLHCSREGCGRKMRKKDAPAKWISRH